MPEEQDTVLVRQEDWALSIKITVFVPSISSRSSSSFDPLKSMFFTRSLLVLLLVAVSCCAAVVPVAHDFKKLAFTRSLNATGTLNIAEADRARFRILKDQALGQVGSPDKRLSSILVTNTAVSF